MKAVFMGTPAFAVPVLRALCDACEVAAVVTRPDAAQGRGQRVQFSPVKEVAVARGIPVLQPVRARDEGFIESLGAFDADVFVVAAYGMILPEAILRLPKKLGCINVHASLLPKLRGAAPIQWAIMNGEKTTGITIMHMDKKLDAGDMIIKREIAIEDDDTGGSMHDKLSALGAAALVDALAQLKSGIAPRIPQAHELSTYAPMLTKEHGHIDWNAPTVRIVNLVRGLNPWPAAYAWKEDKPLKIWRARAHAAVKAEPGTVAGFTGDGWLVGAADGCVEVLEVQAQGTRRMAAADYLRGHPLAVGSRFS